MGLNDITAQFSRIYLLQCLCLGLMLNGCTAGMEFTRQVQALFMDVATLQSGEAPIAARAAADFLTHNLLMPQEAVSLKAEDNPDSESLREALAAQLRQRSYYVQELIADEDGRLPPVKGTYFEIVVRRAPADAGGVKTAEGQDHRAYTMRLHTARARYVRYFECRNGQVTLSGPWTMIRHDG